MIKLQNHLLDDSIIHKNIESKRVACNLFYQKGLLFIHRSKNISTYIQVMITQNDFTDQEEGK